MEIYQNFLKIVNWFLNMGVDIGDSSLPITPVMIRDDKETMLLARKLLEKNICYSCNISSCKIKRLSF